MRRILVALVAVLALAACSGSGDKTAASTVASTDFPTLSVASTLNVSTDAGTTIATIPNPTLNPAVAPTTVAPGSVTTPSVPPRTNPDGSPVVTAPSGVQASGTIYKIQKGDSLAKIAARLGVLKADLIALNNITDENHILVGFSLKVPVARATTPTTKASSTATTKAGTTGGTATTKASTTTPPTDSGVIYVVVSGDSLGSIATKLKVLKSDILTLNNIADPNKVLVGQKLHVPNKR
jgi:LysM repeat protein